MPIGPGAFKTPADGRYHIRISGNPQYYTPAKNYTIKIEGIERSDRYELRYTYIGFALIAIKKDMDIETIPQEFLDSNSGLFSLLHDEALAKIVCGNMVIHTTSSPKSEIGIIWTAPPPGTGCIQFRATVIEHRDVWYMDDGPLSREFCEEDPQTEDTESMLNEKCCACSEARYELTFEGIWSRNTHPKDFPTNTLLTKFSDIIGASHNYNYRFWVYNEKASEAIRLIAEAGETQLLEAELQENRDHIRTIIKARGLAYPYLNNKTVSTFRVNTENHLISMVSMIQPSPDWFVGVSGIELCLSDCSWIENRIINMYPWDAGTDSGPTYTAINEPTNPTDNIRRIKPDSPNDPRSPFYNELNENMEPIARLHITRQRIYDRPCPNSWYTDKHPIGRITPTYTRNDEEEYGLGGGEDTDEDGGGGAGGGRGGGSFGGGGNFGGGGSYGGGGGFGRGGGGFGGHGRGDVHGRGDGTGSGINIPNGGDDEEQAQCALSGWNEWSECSPKCGRGTQFRQREYLNPDAKEYCESANSHLKTTQQRDCISSYADCAGEIITERPEESEEEIECEYSPWTIVERCNVTCGKGYVVKRRTVMAGTDCPQTEITDVCHKRKCRAPPFCYEEPTGDDQECDEDPQTFWFYNRYTLSCLLFSTKCNEHRNRFLTIDDCESVCIHARRTRNNK